MNQVGQLVAEGESILLKRESCSATPIPSPDLPSLRIQPAEKPAAHQTESNNSECCVVLVNYVVDHFFKSPIDWITLCFLSAQPFRLPHLAVKATRQTLRDPSSLT